jgi:hypothetical protein
MAGLHNMVLFGAPDDQLYGYHLPVFSGAVNGNSGHVMMHVYQGLWKVQLDSATRRAYDLKFLDEKTPTNPFPFFSMAPQGPRFKVPEMICNSNFSLSTVAVYGHVEGNPDFPRPESLTDQISTVIAQETVLARKFDGNSKSELTYYIFGTPKQYYMVHFLTDDESSFDQIIAVEVLSADLKALIESSGGILVSVPVTAENGLASVDERVDQLSVNNKWKIQVSPLGRSIIVKENSSGVSGEVKIVGEVYFNANGDLKK